ncbi:hypothetical protein GJ744_010266 [Endocarpon pusillum]|uniref:Uncharacterized protein n=1 Tax=Endocarpon pusillum TaxID=364733 RepID=A0A8H7E5J9_9EURO|nr:hypothetical protein GJ744_010266 [Endocarpon pusillum]
MLSLASYHTVDSPTSGNIENSLPGRMGVVGTKRRCFGASTVERVVNDQTSKAAIYVLSCSYHEIGVTKGSLSDDSLDFEGLSMPGCLLQRIMVRISKQLKRSCSTASYTEWLKRAAIQARLRTDMFSRNTKCLTAFGLCERLKLLEDPLLVSAGFVGCLLGLGNSTFRMLRAAETRNSSA